ncbi:T9SS type A sorting domain-containing protein [Ichthyenterobacterium sp. W332]|uniref:T9SS type A sorting domain-containing protein n=1 Tax=Microcosmobacter mediterraneus TaxID=3075607 RepID=A0ABU2YNV2_9FLAO|nr:T9SS type A sorting domain-containing protein [Ichthyenterobacterium sp. W332]MDT0558940.1 T9SS type A sorting domain-containing protein [Ichthyenterobacterium sp. W332]
MKTKLLLIAMLLVSSVDAQTLTLGTNQSSSATRGPFQRSDDGSSSVYSRGVLHYTSAELAPLTSSATISQINFDLGSTNIITASGDATMVIYMKNSNTTDVVDNPTDWAVAIDGSVVVGSYTFNTANNFPGSEGFMSFILDTDFAYTGGSLEIAVEWDCSNLVPADPMQPNLLFSGNGSLNWHWEQTTGHQSLNYRAGSSSPPTSLTIRKDERVNTQIVYTTGGGGVTPPTSGQVIGEFPEMDGGMEDQTADTTMSSAGSSQAGTPQTQWTVSSTSNSEVREMTNDAALARTGNFSAAWAVKVGSNNVRMQSPSPTMPMFQTETDYIIQFFYRAPTDPGNDLDGGIYMNNTSSGDAGNTTDVTPFAPDTWTKTFRQETTQANSDPSQWGVARLDGDDNGYTDTVRIDDFVVYAGTTLDETAPDSATSGTYDISGNVGWTAPAGGVDGGGYVVFKYSTLPNADNDPNQNGIYEHGNTTTNGTGGLTGTVVYIGTATSFTDVYAPGNFYKIYTVDKAFNYSDEIVVSDTTLGFEENISLDFNIYPNPTKGIVNINANKEVISSVIIYDVLGKTILSTNEIDNGINMSNLKNGIYIIKIRSDKATITKRIIKQ